VSERTTTLPPGRLFIDGEWREAASGATFPTVDPATGETITRLARAGAEDVARAVAAARRAFTEGPWAKMSASDRGRLLTRLADRIEERIDELAELETLDNGKPIFESRHIDLPLVVEVFRYYAGWTTKLTGETIPVRGPFLNYTLREPVGVVAAIVPWNFPMLLSSWKLAPALAAGNTVILKPARLTSLSALRFAEICAEVGVPDGVVNVLTGDGGVVGMGLVEHPGVDKVAFTGSTEVGRTVLRAGAETLKKITLELGGKSPNIVFADADLDRAVRGAYNGIFYGKGEVCAAGSRLFVERAVYDEFLEKLAARAERLRPGDPFDEETRLGAIVSESQLETVLGYVDAGLAEGARLVTGGERVTVDDRGFFLLPTIFADVRNDMRIAREEIFGPVLAAIPFDDVDEAVRMANDNPYGLAAGVWTRDVAKAHGVAHRLQAGTVWINTYNVYDATAPFGGYKASGLGRELGREGLAAYTQVKDVWVNLR